MFLAWVGLPVRRTPQKRGLSDGWPNLLSFRILRWLSCLFRVCSIVCDSWTFWLFEFRCSFWLFAFLDFSTCCCFSTSFCCYTFRLVVSFGILRLSAPRAIHRHRNGAEQQYCWDRTAIGRFGSGISWQSSAFASYGFQSVVDVQKKKEGQNALQSPKSVPL